MNSQNFSKSYIFHFTTLESLFDILKIKRLLPLNEQRELYGEKFREPKYYDTVKGIGDVNIYDRSIFCSIISPEDLKNFKPNPNKIYLIFSPDILLGRKSIFCNGWSYGKIRQDSISFDSTLSLEENLNIWKNTMKESFIRTFHSDGGTYKNELLIEGSLDLKFLSFIYIPKNSTFDQTLLKTLHPDINWIFET